MCAFWTQIVNQIGRFSDGRRQYGGSIPIQDEFFLFFANWIFGDVCSIMIDLETLPRSTIQQPKDKTSWPVSPSTNTAFPRFILLGTKQAETAMNLASANAVSVERRGKVGGIFAVSGSLGRVIGPAALSSLLAWSLRANHRGGEDDARLVDYHAVFVVEMLVMVVVIVLGRKALTPESLMVPIEHRRHGAE